MGNEEEEETAKEVDGASRIVGRSLALRGSNGTRAKSFSVVSIYACTKLWRVLLQGQGNFLVRLDAVAGGVCVCVRVVYPPTPLWNYQEIED